MASLTINAMRQFILDAYPNASMKWRNHIATTPNTRQIVAIYMKLQQPKKKAVKPVEEYHQIDIFEYLLSKEEKGTHTPIAI